MTVRFERIAILGLGLLGGSVALAARRAGLAGSIVAAGRRRAPLEAALRDGVVDAIGDVPTAVSGADLVVLCSPVGAMPALLQEAAPKLRAGALVTDVGSVKGVLADRLPGLLPEGVEYVGAHPMAGSHRRGVSHARADLFDGACCVVTPQGGASPGAVERVVAFWQALGARVTRRDPAAHDVDVAWVSHAPHVLAFAFAHALARAPRTAGELAGSGFRDFTRIAWSDSEMWSEILHTNRKALSGPLQALRRSLAELAEAIESGDVDAQESFLARAHRALAETTGQSGSAGAGGPCADARSGGDHPEIQTGQAPVDPRSVENDS